MKTSEMTGTFKSGNKFIEIKCKNESFIMKANLDQWYFLTGMFFGELSEECKQGLVDQEMGNEEEDELDEDNDDEDEGDNKDKEDEIDKENEDPDDDPDGYGDLTGEG